MSKVFPIIPQNTERGADYILSSQACGVKPDKACIMQDHEFAVLDQPSRIKGDSGMDGISPKRGSEEKL